MAEKQKNIEADIVEYFQTTPLRESQVIFNLVTAAVEKKRRQSDEAKARQKASTKGKKKTTAPKPRTARATTPSPAPAPVSTVSDAFPEPGPTTGQ